PSPRRAGGPPVLCKVPRVSLERLDLDLSGVSRPPVFRVFPGTSSEYFSLIEEQHEVSIRDPQDTKPVLGGTLPKPPTVLGPPKPLSGLGAAPLPPGAPPPLAPNVSCCRVCDQAGAVVMCDRCQRCYHLDCHLPALQDVPSPEWICLLCQDLPPPPLQEGPSQSLSPLDQQVWMDLGRGRGIREGGAKGSSDPFESPQKCEYVLLELLCYEPFRPLRHLSASSASHAALDLTLIRAKLQEKLGPPYR
ncbi:TIF1B factor, partial [Podargus strigoides]|nr:TIF1B factor [Podargus strigoides]